MRKGVFLLVVLLTPFSAQAEGAGIVTHLSGMLVAKLPDGVATRILSVKSEVQEGDTLMTQDNTYARVKFRDEGEVVLRPNSQFVIDKYSYQPEKPAEDNQMVNLLKGGMRMVTGLLGKRNPNKVQVVAPTATIGIRGTHFGLLMCANDCLTIPTISGQPPANGLHIDVAAGAISVTNPAGSQVVGTGQFGYVQSPTAPPVIVPSSQGIQVTMPPAISQNNAGGRSVGKERSATECSVQ